MLKKTITFTDYNGEKVTEDYYFNLSRAEVMELQLSVNGYKDGFAGYLQELVNSKDVPAISQMFKKIILSAYGVKSPDGKRFIKSQEIRDSFEQTEAYSELFMELIQDGEKCKAFIEGVMPAIPEEAKKEAEAKLGIAEASK